ncbi:HAD-IA family hydrolase [Rubrivivax sp. A210]|uniref:HAD-IA family hydrolase n=1 Tax=Rubrivivax sp. A210 TaxID=2772301 RepID=UPI00191969CE|nr:HAD-IA family hydrolase [Rubrivivax sp. A210]
MRALIWDVDGTVAETEAEGHLPAFNEAFAALGLPWRWSAGHYGRLLHVTGGRERLLHDMAARADAPPPAERAALAAELHKRKNALYAERVARGAIAARPGVLRLMDECTRAGVMLAIATTTSANNAEALFARLLGPAWRGRFAAVACGEDAAAKKPDPLVYRLVLQRLDLMPDEAFAIEDSPVGLAAARGAGIECGITASVFFADACFDGAAWVRADLETPAPMTLHGLRQGGSVKIGPSPAPASRP